MSDLNLEVKSLFWHLSNFDTGKNWWAPKPSNANGSSDKSPLFPFFLTSFRVELSAQQHLKPVHYMDDLNRALSFNSFKFTREKHSKVCLKRAGLVWMRTCLQTLKGRLLPNVSDRCVVHLIRLRLWTHRFRKSPPSWVVNQCLAATVWLQVSSGTSTLKFTISYKCESSRWK